MKFIKTFFGTIGAHLAMCLLPFFFLPILNTDPRYTVDMPKSAGQIIIYALYFLAFFAVYFYVGRVLGGKLPGERINLGGILGRFFASAVIVAAGLYVYHGVIVPQKLENGVWSIFAMSQLMLRRAITDDVVGNKTLATVAMVMPGIIIWAGFLSNGFKKKN